MSESRKMAYARASSTGQNLDKQLPDIKNDLKPCRDDIIMMKL